MRKITKEEATLLAQARFVLDSLSKTDFRRTRDSDLDALGILSWGRVAHAADVAEQAIFDYLNIANSHCDDEVAGRFVHEKIDPNE